MRSPHPDRVAPGQPAPRACWARALVAAAALFGLLLILYWRAVDFELIVLDDPHYTVGNPLAAKGLDGANIVRAFAGPPDGDLYIPVTHLSFMADVELFGMAPRGFHLTNIVLHAIDMALLLLLLWRMTGALARSAFAAALVGLHPMRVESVAWVAERKDVLAVLFLLLSLCCYLRYVRTRRWGWYGALLLCAGLGLLAKPILVTLPLLLLLLDFWPLDRIRREPRDGAPRLPRLVAEKLPPAALAALVSLATFYLQAEDALHAGVSPASRLEHALSSAFIYLFQTAWPMDLAFRHFDTYWKMASGSLLPAAAGFAAVTAIVVRHAGRRPCLAFGWGWYVIALVPVSGIVPTGSQWIADRFTYVPHVGLAMALAWTAGGSRLARRLPRPVLAAAAGLALLPLAFLTGRQLPFWADGATLFARSVERYPDDGRYRDSYVAALIDRGDYAAARRHAELLLPYAADPGSGASVQMNYLTVLERTGDSEEAIAQARRFLGKGPVFARTRLWLAERLFAKGRYSEAALEFRNASAERGARPEDKERAMEGLGIALARMGRDDDALASLNEALRQDPARSSVHYHVAMILVRRGDPDAALAHFRKAIELEPGEVKPRLGVADLLMSRGDVNAAVRQYDYVARRLPGKAESFYARGRILEAAGMSAAARPLFEEALASPPVFSDTPESARQRLAAANAPAAIRKPDGDTGMRRR